VLVDKIPVFMGKMFENGILFLNDIVTWNGIDILHGVITGRSAQSKSTTN
jgi:hypothetical protein